MLRGVGPAGGDGDDGVGDGGGGGGCGWDVDAGVGGGGGKCSEGAALSAFLAPFPFFSSVLLPMGRLRKRLRKAVSSLANGLNWQTAAVPPRNALPSRCISPNGPVEEEE